MLLNASETPINYLGMTLYVPHHHFAAALLIDTKSDPEPYMRGIFEKYLKPGSIAIDIGANIGFHTLSMSQLVGHSGKIYAVEADIDNVSTLRRSLLASGLSNVSLLPIAASDETGVLPMMSSAQTNSSFSHLANENASKVAVTARLDDIITDKIDFIKIDVEGAEMLAFRGMERLMAKSRPIVVSEFSPNYMFDCLGADVSTEYLNFFIYRGYQIFYLKNDGSLHILNNIAEVTSARDKAFFEYQHGHIDLLFVPSRFKGL